MFFFPDTHRPYHHKRHFALALKACKAFRPKKPNAYRVIIKGDFADAFCVSDHDKDPSRSRDLAWELEDVKQGLAEIREAAGPDAEIDYVEGNHENRLTRYVQRRCPELFGILKYPDMVGCKDLGIRFHPYRKHITIGKLHITHDTGNAGQFAHYKAQSIFQGNVVIGHTHRIGYMIAGNALGKPHVGAMFGHLSDVEQIDYAHRIQTARDWAYGFGYGYMDPKTGYVHLVPCPIVGNTVVIDGQVVKG